MTFNREIKVKKVDAIAIPEAQDPTSFFLNPNLWEDTPASRLGALNSYNDEAFHLPENFIDKFQESKTKRTEKGYVNHLLKDLSEPARIKREMAALWVVTGNCKQCQSFVNREKVVRGLAQQEAEENGAFINFIKDYEMSNSPRPLAALKKLQYRANDRPPQSLGYIESLKKLMIREREIMEKEYPLHFSYHEKVSEEHCKQNPSIEDLVKIARHEPMKALDFVEKERFNTGYDYTDILRKQLLEDADDMSQVERFNSAYNAMKVGFEQREFKATQQPNPYGLVAMLANQQARSKGAS